MRQECVGTIPGCAETADNWYTPSLSAAVIELVISVLTGQPLTSFLHRLRIICFSVGRTENLRERKAARIVT